MIECWLAWVDAHNGAVTAIATAVIGIFTIALVIVSWRQARLIASQIGLAREEFISSHRPKLIVRAFRLLINETTKEARVRYRITNIGDTTATIVTWNESWIINANRAFPSFPTYLPNKDIVGIIPLETGDYWIGGIAIEGDGSNGYGGMSLHQRRDACLFVYGHISYGDKFGRTRELRFCRLFNHQTERFDVFDAEHDYAD